MGPVADRLLAAGDKLDADGKTLVQELAEAAEQLARRVDAVIIGYDNFQTILSCEAPASNLVR